MCIETKEPQAFITALFSIARSLPVEETDEEHFIESEAMYEALNPILVAFNSEKATIGDVQKAYIILKHLWFLLGDAMVKAKVSVPNQGITH